MEQEKINEELNQFKKYLVLNYSLRKITIEGHIGNIKRMIQEIQIINPEKEDIINYVYNLKNSNKSFSHISNNIYSVERYMDFKKNLVRFSKPRRLKSIIKETLSESEITRIIQASKNIKEKAILLVLAYSGIRNKSLCDLKLKDLDIGNNSITIRKPKGRTQYVSNIPAIAINILLEYLKMFPRKSEDYLFTTWVRNNKYSTSDIRKFVKVVSKRAGINKRVYVHLFRHSLASKIGRASCRERV